MREGWTYKKLGEVASYINGYAFKPEQWKESGTPIIRIQNLNNPEAPYNYYDGEVPEKVKIQNGDLLISWSASLGAYIWDGGAAFLNQHIFKVEFDKTDIDKMYLKYAVTSKLEAMANLVHGATMKHIVKKDFDNTLIPYPSKSQQEAIVSELDEINSLLALKREQLQKYDKLAQSLFYELFGDPVENEKGWEISSLSYICASITDGSHNPPKGIGKSSYLMLSSKNIKDGALSLEDPRYLTESEYIVENKRTNVQKGDILLTIVGTIGRCCIFDSSDSIVFQRSVAVLKPKNFVNSQYLMHHIIALRDNLENEAKGVAQKGIYLKQLGRIQMLLPPLPLQQQFASRIEQIEEQKQQVQAAIEKLETLLASRMQYWFE